ncbi:hypothetical protein [Actinopolyspora halophila]|uniref:hypothetical protein n=1 Tax=Actinopolyspora halophila TaxID=1850 RepID=UPI000374E4B7|nr:hypothetical protein [Actinopolyspora halophila]
MTETTYRDQIEQQQAEIMRLMNLRDAQDEESEHRGVFQQRITAVTDSMLLLEANLPRLEQLDSELETARQRLEQARQEHAARLEHERHRARTTGKASASFGGGALLVLLIAYASGYWLAWLVGVAGLAGAVWLARRAVQITGNSHVQGAEEQHEVAHWQSQVKALQQEKDELNSKVFAETT